MPGGHHERVTGKALMVERPAPCPNSYLLRGGDSCLGREMTVSLCHSDGGSASCSAGNTQHHSSTLPDGPSSICSLAARISSAIQTGAVLTISCNRCS